MAIQKKRMTVVCAGLAACSVLVSAATQAQAVSFEEARNFEVGSRPLSVAVGDFNGDGVQDLVVSNRNSNNVSVFLGNGDGTFQAARNFNAGSTPSSVAVGDFNGDGWQDLVLAAETEVVVVLLGNGDGTFGGAQWFGAGLAPFSVVVGDFNGDMRPDLAVANQNSNSVSVLINNTSQ